MEHIYKLMNPKNMSAVLSKCNLLLNSQMFSLVCLCCNIKGLKTNIYLKSNSRLSLNNPLVEYIYNNTNKNNNLYLSLTLKFKLSRYMGLRFHINLNIKYKML